MTCHLLGGYESFREGGKQKGEPDNDTNLQKDVDKRIGIAQGKIHSDPRVF
jgi:hypothetical protein